MSIRITGTGSCLPPLAVSNDQLSQILDTSHEWIFSRTGIQARHICQEGLTPVAAAAGQGALDDAGIGVEDLDYILCATISGDYMTPSLACLVQEALGGSCPSLDISAACSGFIYGLELGQALIDSGKARRILLIAAEAMSSTVDWTQRDVSVLFGDGAGAAVLEKGEDLLSIRLGSEGWARPLYMRRPAGNCPYGSTLPPEDVYLHMDGREIFKFAVNAMVQDVGAVVAEAGIGWEDVDYVLPHQANRRILEAAARKLPLGPDLFLSNIEETGNTSAASIPILLDQKCKDGTIQAGHTLVMSAFGAGLTRGACVLRWTLEKESQGKK